MRFSNGVYAGDVCPAQSEAERLAYEVQSVGVLKRRSFLRV